MKISPNNIFNQTFYWKFKAPNSEELSEFVMKQKSGDPVPWGKLCSVKMTQILDDILPMMQPSINKFCEELDQRMLMSMNRPWVSHTKEGIIKNLMTTMTVMLLVFSFQNIWKGIHNFIS
tara:strand:+ start:4851 stop:5210 length:360 start_codon:yes stop_codon:yes gene_type:complete